MIGSLAKDKLAPSWLKDKHMVPYRGILFSGISMLSALWFGMLFPSVYLFLISAGGFSILFAYVMIMATHIRFRRKKLILLDGKRQKNVFPYASLITLLALLAVIMGMPFVAGQETGMFAGGAILSFFATTYLVMLLYQRNHKRQLYHVIQGSRLQPEFSKELGETVPNQKKTVFDNDQSPK